ncbi:MAG TPA: nicotinamide riboside transporter PnuC, partial [Lacunisphaera sp.]|nr:nicotinamide riboside transporter PnuC [Lacunisphaera sp.]
MHTVWQNIWSGLTTASPLDQANLLLGIAGVWLMIRRSLWAFPVGLAAVTVQGILFYQTHFPADATLQVYYFVLLAWGWWHWIKGKGAAPELPVTRLSPRGWAVTLAGSALATVVWAIIVGPMMHAAMPWRDAFIAMFS